MAAQTHICNIKDIFLKEVLRRCPFYGRNKIEERDLINRKKLPKAARVEYDIPSSMRLIEFERTWHVAVSYTHLDVYKRQENIQSVVCSFFLF